MYRVLSSPVGAILEIILASHIPLLVLLRLGGRRDRRRSENGPLELVGASRRRSPPADGSIVACSFWITRVAGGFVDSAGPWPEPPSIRVPVRREHQMLRTLDGVGSKPTPRFQSNGRFGSLRDQAA